MNITGFRKGNFPGNFSAVSSKKSIAFLSSVYPIMDWKNILKQQKPCIPVLVPGVTHFKVRPLVSNANFVSDHVYIYI